MDRLDISPGKHWDSEVEKALAACPRMAIVLSPQSVNSANVVDEFSYALGEGKLVIPLLYRDCPIPFRLRRLQHIDFRKDYDAGLTELLSVLEVTSGPSVAESPAAHEPDSALPQPLPTNDEKGAVVVVPEVADNPHPSESQLSESLPSQIRTELQLGYWGEKLKQSEPPKVDVWRDGVALVAIVLLIVVVYLLAASGK